MIALINAAITIHIKIFSFTSSFQTFSAAQGQFYVHVEDFCNVEDGWNARRLQHPVHLASKKEKKRYIQDEAFLVSHHDKAEARKNCFYLKFQNFLKFKNLFFCRFAFSLQSF
jgi:hypothetical protein